MAGDKGLTGELAAEADALRAELRGTLERVRDGLGLDEPDDAALLLQAAERMGAATLEAWRREGIDAAEADRRTRAFEAAVAGLGRRA